MTVQELFNRAVSDKLFWKELQKDPAKAFKDAGVTVTPEQLRDLKKLNYRVLEEVAVAFGSGSGNIT